ncbi:hypothetical protein [Methanoplanus limicola]|uniref:hypothetical protein n=1 Tax=Methanoplanus limicola TaxID=2315 RepID=UPI00373AEF6D
MLFSSNSSASSGGAISSMREINSDISISIDLNLKTYNCMILPTIIINTLKYAEFEIKYYEEDH